MSKENQCPEKEEFTTQNEVETNVENQNAEDVSADNMTEPAEQAENKDVILTEQVALWQDKYMRLSAEFDNYRKRTLKEKIDLTQSASEGVIKNILPIMDDFDRAIDAMAKSDDIDSLRSGVELIYKRFGEVMQREGVKIIEAKDAELDTDFHDAIAKFPIEDESKKGKVIDVVEKGYTLKDKVIRFAKVVVGV